MSDERFQFLYDFQVQDQQLERAADRLFGVNKALEEGTRRLKAFEAASGAFKKVGDSAWSALPSVRSLGGALASAAASIAKFAAGSAVAGGALAFAGLNKFGDSFTTAAGERTSAIRSRTTFLDGDRGQAELEFYRAQKFGQQTDFTSQTIEQGQSRLLAQGFRGNDLYASLFSAADLAAASPDDKNEALKRITTAMAQIKAKGKLQGEELTGQLAEAGLSTTLVREEIRKALGLKSTGDVDKKISAGEISSDVALPAIQRAILAQLHTTKAGEFAASSSGSLTSLLSNRDEAFANLSKSFDADQALPAMERYKASLRTQAEQMDVTTSSGKNMVLTLQDMANQTTHAKASWEEFSGGFLESFSRTYSDELHKMDPESFRSAANGLADFGSVLGRLGTTAAQAMHALDGLSGSTFFKFVTGSDDENRSNGYRKLREAQEDADKQAFDEVRTNAMRKLSAAGMTIGEYSTKDIFTQGAGGFGFGPAAPTKEELAAAKAKGKVAASLSSKKGKAEAGWNVLLTNYEPWFNGAGAGGMGGNAAGVDAISSAVESSLSSGVSQAGRAVIVNQQINITVPSSEIAQRVAGELRSVRDTIADELRTLARAPRASARR